MRFGASFTYAHSLMHAVRHDDGTRFRVIYNFLKFIANKQLSTLTVSQASHQKQTM